jgi:hypothetical protein
MKPQSKTLFVAAGSVLLTLIACAAPAQPTAASAQESSAIRWEVSQPDDGDGDPRLQLRAKQSTSSIALDGARAEFSAARDTLGGGRGPVSFSVVHAAGRLDCTGSLNAAYEGEGQCRFAPDAGFATALESRGVGTPTRKEQLAMLMVDATVELADGLIDAGLRPHTGELVAAAALKVTPAYVRDLQSGALRLTSINDAIACKALGVDRDYVRGLAAAGYAKLTSDQVISMKALGITPDYARSMNAAAGGTQ